MVLLTEDVNLHKVTNEAGHSPTRLKQYYIAVCLLLWRKMRLRRICWTPEATQLRLPRKWLIILIIKLFRFVVMLQTAAAVFLSAAMDIWKLYSYCLGTFYSVSPCSTLQLCKNLLRALVTIIFWKHLGNTTARDVVWGSSKVDNEKARLVFGGKHDILTSSQGTLPHRIDITPWLPLAIKLLL